MLEAKPVKECITVDQYRMLVSRIGQAVHQNIPSDSTVLVFSKGDDALVELNGHRGWHFPQNSEGVYARHYPADSTEVIQNLENLL